MRAFGSAPGLVRVHCPTTVPILPLGVREDPTDPGDVLTRVPSGRQYTDVTRVGRCPSSYTVRPLGPPASPPPPCEGRPHSESEVMVVPIRTSPRGSIPPYHVLGPRWRDTPDPFPNWRHSEGKSGPLGCTEYIVIRTLPEMRTDLHRCPGRVRDGARPLFGPWSWHCDPSSGGETWSQTGRLSSPGHSPRPSTWVRSGVSSQVTLYSVSSLTRPCLSGGGAPSAQEIGVARDGRRHQDLRDLKVRHRLCRLPSKGGFITGSALFLNRRETRRRFERKPKRRPSTLGVSVGGRGREALRPLRPRPVPYARLVGPDPHPDTDSEFPSQRGLSCHGRQPQGK